MREAWAGAVGPRSDPPATWADGLVVARRAGRASGITLEREASSDAERPGTRVCAAPRTTSSPPRETASGVPLPDSDTIAVAQRAAGEPHPGRAPGQRARSNLEQDATMAQPSTWLNPEGRGLASRRWAWRRARPATGLATLAVVDRRRVRRPRPATDARPNRAMAHGQKRASAPGQRGRVSCSDRRAPPQSPGLVRRSDVARAIRARRPRGSLPCRSVADPPAVLVRSSKRAFSRTRAVRAVDGRVAPGEDARPPPL